MSIEGIGVAFVIALSFAVWIALPFIERVITVRSTRTPVERQRERLLIYYERVLRNIHDIDEDYATGKLSEDDYALERERWAQRGIAALRKLDELNSQNLVAPEKATVSAIDSAIDQSIESALEKQLDASGGA
jgi:hypothetical protein